MTMPTIADYLKYANLQLAAEAFIRDESTGILATSSPDVIDALKAGNNHASRFTETEATKFASEWRVLDQRANTKTGFSGTLFINTKTDELVVSFRSTEFIDDAARDNEATNKLEIGDFGFAFGQLSDMEAWYAELSASGGALNGKNFSVTGYSLGGHLATAFNLMHPSAASQVVTFNGAGIGKIGNGSLADTQTKLPQMIAEFQALRAQSDTAAGLEGKLTNLEVRATYRLIKTAIAANGGVPNESMLAMLPVTGGSEAALLADALNTAIKIAKEAVRAPALTSGPGTTTGSPKDIQHQDIAGESLDYQLAVRLCSQKYDTSALNILVGGSNIWFGKTMGAWSSAVTNQWDLVGTETTATPTAMVANSQYHYGVDTHVFIEDQPLYRGSAPSDMVKTSFANSGFKLLVAGYNQNDFGDTHSLVLIIDSLNVQNLLLTLAPSATQAQIETFFKAASAAKAESLTGSQGRCEGDVLETVLNALSQQLLGKDITKLDGKLEGNTWADFTDRSGFYERIKTLTADGGAFKNLTGKVTLALPDGRIATAARTDFAAFLALQTLSPFVLKALPGKESEVEALLRPSWETEYLAWNDDTQLTPEQRAKGEGTYTDLYLADRAAMLGWVTKAKLANTALNAESLKSSAPASQLQNAMWDFTDIANRISVTVSPSDWISINPDRRRVVFGGEENDNVNGYDKDDHIYGGTGTDTLDGGKGADYLEGNAGLDTLNGGEDKDTLLGGEGNDILTGGADNDRLLGGTGHDTYQYSSGDGHDTLRDADGDGHIEIDGQRLNGGQRVAPGGTLWKSADGKHSYLVTGDLASGATLVIDGVITVEHYKSGQLGLTLEDAPAPNPPQTTPAPYGTAGNDLISGQNGSGASPDELHGREGSDILVGGDGNNALEGDLQQFTGDPDVPAGASAVFNWSIDVPATWWAANDFPHHAQWVSLGHADELYANERIDLAALTDYGTYQGSGNGSQRTWLSAGGGDDRVVGSGGQDVLLGGAGGDLLLGGNGDDFLDGALDMMVYGLFDDVPDIHYGFGYGVENRFAYQIAEPNYRHAMLDPLAGDGDDTAFGGAGNDRLWGWQGSDALWGDDGDDLISGGGGNDALFGGNGADQLTGDDNNLLAGDSRMVAGDDLLDGGDGDDELQGEAGDDRLLGGEGNDILWGDARFYQMDHARDGDDWLDGGGGQDDLVGGGGQDTLQGGAGDDKLFGDADDTPEARQGNDHLDGGAGNDYLRGYAGDDILLGGDGHDELLAEAGRDRLQGGAGNDTLDAGDDNDELDGGAGDDKAYGGSGDDRIAGGEGSDRLFGDDGNDEIAGGEGSDVMFGGAGNDRIDGGGGDDALQGDAGNDTLISSGGRDSLQGGDGDETLTGTSEQDRIAGGKGRDTPTKTMPLRDPIPSAQPMTMAVMVGFEVKPASAAMPATNENQWRQAA